VLGHVTATSTSSLRLSDRTFIALQPSAATSTASLSLTVIHPAGDISLWVEETVKYHYFHRNTETLAIWTETMTKRENPTQERLIIEPDEQIVVTTPPVEYALHLEASVIDLGFTTIKEDEKTLYVKDNTVGKITPTG
jgi:hypothetical protein